MKQLSFLTAIMFMFSIGAIIVGCSKSDTGSTPNTTLPNVGFQLSPPDRSNDVRLDEKIIISFAKPVDRAIVERNFHLTIVDSNPDTSCMNGSTMNHNMMNNGMMDSMMTHHMNSSSQIRGTFTWSDNNMQCTFKPDSMMMSETWYAMHVGSEMMKMMHDRMSDSGGMMSDKNGMMGNGSGMMGNGKDLMAKDAVSQFRTMNKQKDDSGHREHHR